MKNFLEKKYVQIGVTAFCVIAASLLFYFGIFHTASIAKGFNKLYTILTPIVYAAAMSYVLWPIVRFMERSVIYRICKKKNWNHRKNPTCDPYDLCHHHIVTVLAGYLWIAVHADSGTDQQYHEHHR